MKSLAAAFICLGLVCVAFGGYWAYANYMESERQASFITRAVLAESVSSSGRPINISRWFYGPKASVAIFFEYERAKPGKDMIVATLVGGVTDRLCDPTPINYVKGSSWCEWKDIGVGEYKIIIQLNGTTLQELSFSIVPRPEPKLQGVSQPPTSAPALTYNGTPVAASSLPLVVGDSPEAPYILQALEETFPLTKFCRRRPIKVVKLGKDEWASVSFFDAATCMGRSDWPPYSVILRRADTGTWSIKCNDRRGDLPEYDYYLKHCGSLPREAYSVLFGVARPP
jgi:hypothetical protein